MVIEIDDSVFHGFDYLTNTEVNSLCNLALAGIEGNHLIVCPIPLSKVLASDKRLNEREQIFFKRMASEYPTWARVASQVKTSVLVMVDKVEHVETTAGTTKRHVLLKRFSSLDSIQPTKLVCEDFTDCTLLTAITQVFFRQSSLKNVSLKVDPVAGGGCNTWYALKRIQENEKRFAFCVVDTDLKPTSWKLGDTSKKVRNYMESCQSYRLGFHILKCHELENLTPDDLFSGRHKSFQVCCTQTGRNIAELGDQSLYDARLHLDIKRGLSLKDLLRCANTNSSSHTWMPLLSAIDAGRVFSDPRWASCIAGQRCQRASDCDCIIFKPLGDNLLAAVEIAWLRHGKDLWSSLPGYLKMFLEEVCLLIGSWGCAPSPQRS